MSLAKRLLAAGLTAGLIFAPVATTSFTAVAHADSGVVAESGNPADSAANWLMSQFVDGKYVEGFSGSASATSDALLSLAAAGKTAKDLEKSTTWLAEQVKNDTEYTGATAAKGVLAAVALGMDPKNFHGVNLVEKMQAGFTGQPGKYGCYPDALLISAMVATKTQISESYLDAVLAQQHEDGSYGYFDKKQEWQIDPDTTALIVEAFDAAVQSGSVSGAMADKVKAAEAKAIATLKAKAVKDEHGTHWENYSPANSTGLVLSAFVLTKQPDTADIEKWLVGKQLSDGSFGASAAAQTGDVYATTQALLGLAHGSLVMSPKPAPTPTPEPEPTTPADPTADFIPSGEHGYVVEPNVDKAVTDQWITVELAGFQPNEEVEVWLYSDPVLLGKVKVNAQGKGTFKFKLPKDVTGKHHIVAKGLGGKKESVKSKVITIGKPALPRTGVAGIDPMALLAFSTLAMGAGALVASRKN